MRFRIIRNEEELSKWFKKNYRKLGYIKILKDNKGAFPDFIMLRGNRKVRVELETYSSNFKIHKHDVNNVDEIVCFKHNSKYNPPLKIIEIKKFFEDKLNRNTPFISFFENKPNIRLWDYLLTEKDLDFSITDMAKNSGIGRSTLYRIWDGLIKNKIIISTRIIGKAKLYKLNKENTAVKKLIEMDDALILEDLKNRSEKYGIKVPQIIN